MGYGCCRSATCPTVDFPTIQVQANLPGASPDTMAASVATPLEKQFSTIAGVTSISSSNGQGNTNITLQFDLSRNIDSAAQDVQSMIARAPLAAARHAVAAVVSEGEPGRSAGSVPHAQLRHAAAVASSTSTRRRCWRSACRWCSGVAQVNVFGAQKFAVRIDVDPTQLARAADRHRSGRAGRRRRERESADRHALRRRSATSSCRRAAS